MMDIFEEINNNPTIAFIVGFTLFYSIFIQKDPKVVFFVIALFIIMYILYINSQKKTIKKNVNVETYITGIEKKLSDDSEIPENKIYYIHKTPRSLKYIKQTHDIRDIIFDLKFLEIYDIVSYYKLISYIEYFLKIHYKILLNKYDYETYFPILKDIRAEILNTMKGVYYNIPDISRIILIDNINDYLEERIFKLQAKTYRYIKILYHKYGSSKDKYEAPFDNDSSANNHYSMF